MIALQNTIMALNIELDQLKMGNIMNIDTSKIVVFDSGTKYMDRYTVLPYFLNRKEDSLTRSMYLSVSECLMVSMWNEIGKQIGDKYYAPYMFELKHLGKRLKFSDLPSNVQSHILNRLED